jgi:hypothetical protein
MDPFRYTSRYSLPRYSYFIRTLRSPRQRRVTSTEARIIARLDALRRNLGSEEELGQLIQEELNGVPAGQRDKLLSYFERWLDRQCLALLEEWTPTTGIVQ